MVLPTFNRHVLGAEPAISAGLRRKILSSVFMYIVRSPLKCTMRAEWLVTAFNYLTLNFSVDAKSEVAMSTEMNLLDFAERALSHVSSLTLHISGDGQSEGARNLTHKLNHVRAVIDEFAKQSDYEKCERDVQELVNDLESLCNWPDTSAGRNQSILRALLHSEHIGSIYEETRKKVLKSLGDFTCKPPLEQEQYLPSFFSFVSLSSSRGNTPSQHRLGRNLTKSFELPEYPLQVNSTLYSILPQVRGCACKRKHESRLSLRSGINRCNHCAFSFDMLIRSLPPYDTRWQDVQVCFKKSRQPVGNADDIDDASNSPSNKPDVDDESLCGLSKDLRGSALSLEVGDTGLRKLCNHMPSKQHVGSESSHPLREILETHCLSTKEKLILSYTIALSFWRYYDPHWMDVSWTSNSIHFFSEAQDPRETPRHIYANKPYLAVTPDSGPFDEYAENDKVLYRYPRILALCIILLEIVMGRPLNFDQNKEQVDEINLQWSDARKLVNSNWKVLLNFDYQTFQSALVKCLDMQTFDNAKGQDDVNGRKKILFSILVEPLYRLINELQYLHALEKVDSMRPIRLRPPSNFPQASDGQVAHAKGQDAAQVACAKGSDAALSKAWLLEVQQFNTKVHQFFGGFKGNPVKVAILDTGCDKKSIFFRDPSRRDQVKFKDFAGNENEAVDIDGHGTHTTSLVMKLAPEAQIFVARITKTNDQIRNARESICKAIEYAAIKWKVDIISMSFGFPDYDKEIVKVIQNAEIEREERLLFFAAASNYGINHPEMFPARCDSVISIRRTDTHGDFSPMNPPIDPHGASVFGTLGHQVEAAWLSQVDGIRYEGPKVASGSSVATAIASGIAAMVLTHATMGFESDHPPTEDVKGLWTRYGMLAMFITMSCDNDKDHRQRFFSPQELSSKINGLAHKVLAKMETSCKPR